MRDLAPEITRQRLLLEGYYTADVDEPTIRKFLQDLPETLNLRTYGEATVFAPGGASGAKRVRQLRQQRRLGP